MIGVRSFLGPAEFYWHLIKDFSKIDHPLYKILKNKVKFELDGDYLRSLIVSKSFLCKFLQ